MISLTAKELATLLKAAAKAHGTYEKEELGGVYDKDWPLWYAKWMIKHQPKPKK